MIPNITETNLDGQLGALPQLVGVPPVVIGAAQIGAYNTPAAYARKQNFPATYGACHTSELASQSVNNTQVPVIFIRTGNVTDGDGVPGNAGAAVVAANGVVSDLDQLSSAWTATINESPPADPDSAKLMKIRWVNGGVIGVTGMYYQISDDDGATYGDPVALGTDTTITVLDTWGHSGVRVNLGSGTIAAKEWVSFTTTAPTLASDGTLDVTGVTGGGTVVITTTYGVPSDDLDVVVEVLTGFTAGVTGGVYKVSYDNGVTWETPVALGTSTHIYLPAVSRLPDAHPEYAGWGFTLSGAFIAGDTWSTRTTAPNFNSAQLTAGLTALANSSKVWNSILVAGPVDATTFAVLEAWKAARDAAGKPCTILCHWRMPTLAEEIELATTGADPTYQAAFIAQMGALSSAGGALTVSAGDCICVSVNSGRAYRRPAFWDVAARLVTCSAELNLAQPVSTNVLGATSIRDSNGNPRNHDEAQSPGLDDARALTLRTHDDFEGVFINRPHTFAPTNSDYTLLPIVRVFQYGRRINRAFFYAKLSGNIPVNSATGYIIPRVAQQWEKDAKQRVSDALQIPKMASSCAVTISRTDNLRALNAIMHVEFRLGNLAYVENIAIENALQAPTAG